MDQLSNTIDNLCSECESLDISSDERLSNIITNNNNNNKGKTLNVYFLENMSDPNNNNNENILKVLHSPTKVFINYGETIGEFDLSKGDTIRWNENVIIKIGNLDHYKCRVSASILIVIAHDDMLDQSTYIEPINIKMAPGNVWETR